MNASYDLKCGYPICGFNPEFRSACIKVRKAYGQCCGPCDSPCYIASSSHYTKACALYTPETNSD